MKNVKKTVTNIMLSSIAGAAAIAVVSVLVGEFNDSLRNALNTLLLVIVHSLLMVSYASRKSGSMTIGGTNFFSNTLFAIIIMSFFTSVLGVWGALSSFVVGRMYALFFVFSFAALHGEGLHETTGNEKRTDAIVYVNYIFMLVVIAMLIPIILTENPAYPDMYYRLLTAAGIIDATLTIMAVILHRLYIQEHPKVDSALFTVATTYDSEGKQVQVPVAQQKRRTHPLLMLLYIYIGAQIIGSFFAAIFGF